MSAGMYTPNGLLTELADESTGMLTRWDEHGNVIESRPLTAEEIVALTPVVAPNPKADAYEALAAVLDGSPLASERELAAHYRTIAALERGA